MPDSAAWTLDSIAPPDNTFRDAPEDVRRAFWRFIAARGVDRFRWRCGMGLDRHGVGLAPISERTRRKGRWRSHTGQGTADNPPLVPALGRSRTEDLIRGRGFQDRAEWYWATDEVTGKHWGQVMLWHRQGAGHLPVRDVIGWSEDDIAWLRQQGATWWYAVRNGMAVAEQAQRLELEPERFKMLAGKGPVKFKRTGRTDLENFTFGIGGNKERSRRAIEEGFSTGFRQLRPERGPRGTPRPKPAPKPMIPRPPIPRGVPVVTPKVAAASLPLDLATFAQGQGRGGSRPGPHGAGRG